MEQFQNPDMGALTKVPGYGQTQDIMNMIGNTARVPEMGATALPEIRDLLGVGGQATSPYARQINEMTATNVANTQSDMMKRGLTGSDIEAQGMGQARLGGQNAMADMYAKTANQLAQHIYNAAWGDLTNNRETIMALAQAMGQELTSQRDLEQFQRSLQASMDMAKDANRTAMYSAALGGGGAIAGGFASRPSGGSRRPN